MTEPSYEHRPPQPRWTHIALRVKDIEATIDWYTSFTPLELLQRREDADGYGAWLGMPESTNSPFILVVAQFLEGQDPFGGSENAVLAPFAHLGMEMTTSEQVDEMAARGAEAGCLAMAARQMPAPIGYICMLRDPDGNMVEFSFDQGVYAAVHDRWGDTGDGDTGDGGTGDA